MEKEKSNNKKLLYLIGSILFVVLFIGAVTLSVISSVEANKTSELGIDPKENVTKIYTVDETMRIVGKSDGEVYAIDFNGEKLWSAGSLKDVSVYDIAASGGEIYVAYANGDVISFKSSDAAENSGAENFVEKCKVYSTSENIEGNVSNTSLLVSEDGKTVYLRAIFRTRGSKNKIVAFDTESGSKKNVEQSSRKVSGSAVSAGKLYYSVGSKVMVYDGEEKTEIVDTEEQIVSLSVNDGSVFVITENNNIAKINPENGQTERSALTETLNGSYVFSTGENFIAKINNGGVAFVDTASMKITLSMSSSNDAGLIMWSDDGFALRDDSDVNNTFVI